MSAHFEKLNARQSIQTWFWSLGSYLKALSTRVTWPHPCLPLCWQHREEAEEQSLLCSSTYPCGRVKGIFSPHLACLLLSSCSMAFWFLPFSERIIPSCQRFELLEGRTLGLRHVKGGFPPPVLLTHLWVGAQNLRSPLIQTLFLRNCERRLCFLWMHEVSASILSF